jgi:hypothetical protein
LSNYLKPVLALVVSILVFVGYIYLANAQLLNFIQTRFYNPSIVNSYVKENTIDAEFAQNHILELQRRFAATLIEPAVRSSFLYNQSAEDIYERSRLYGILLESISGLQAVQFVDNNGIRMHYSTSSRDIISRNSVSTAYRNYNEDPFALPFDIVSVPAGNSAKFTMDEQGDRIIFSYPFNDSMDVYRGTALFYVSIRALAEKFVSEGRLKVSDSISVIREPPGILLGSPETYKSDIYKKVSEIWNEGIQGRVVLDAEDSRVSFSLISFRTESGMFFGRLINDILFSISDSMKLLFQLSMFLTFYLTLFFLINLKPNPVTLVRNRIKNLRENLFEQLYVNKSAQDRAKWILELEQRRDGIRLELKRNIKLRSRLEANIDSIIDKSWDELLTVIKSGSGRDFQADQFSAADKPSVVQKTENVEDIEEIDEAEELEEVEEIDEAEELDEIEEIDEAEELEEVEEIDEAEELDEIEEIDGAEELEEVEEIGEAEELDEVEEMGEAEELDETEEIDEAEEFEELDEIEETNVAPSKGLLGLASEIETETAPSKGLLGLASKIETETAPSKGLLGLASEIETERAEEVNAAPSKGLLGLASEIEDEKTEDKEAPKGLERELSHKGLLALASEIEFSQKFPVLVSEPDTLPAELDIVSPFSSMFSSLGSSKNFIDTDTNDKDEESKDDNSD